MTCVLMIGCHRALVAGMSDVLPKGSVVVLEEPDIVRRKQIRDVEREYPMVREVWHTAYQEHDAFEPLVELLGQTYEFEAVLAGFEYAVPAAARAAELLGVPGLTHEAAMTLRNKDRLRAVCERAGMPGPAWQVVEGPEDVALFNKRHEAVLKPANRQASLGVVRLPLLSDAHAAWAEVTDLDEGPHVTDRGLQPRYMVEELLQGPEYSTEVLVLDGRVLFCNVTAKLTAAGRYPVELGHVVPAPLDGIGGDAFRAQAAALVDAVGISTGLLHAEWILVDGVPYLVECAGRVPGDFIVEMVDVAYHTSLRRLMLHVLCGDEVPAPQPGMVAGIRFLTAEPGTVTRVGGVEAAALLPGVADVEVSVAAGAEVLPLQSSWQRVGHVMAFAPDHDALAARLDAAVSAVEIVTEPAAGPPKP